LNLQVEKDKRKKNNHQKKKEFQVLIESGGVDMPSNGKCLMCAPQSKTSEKLNQGINKYAKN
jgi:hypothetical protein